MKRLLLVMAFLSGVAVAQSEVQSPLSSRVSQSVTSWSQAEILDGFGNSKPGAFTGSGVSGGLARAGRFVKWGGIYVAGPLLLNAALNWFYDSARRSTSPTFDNWWLGTNFPPPVSGSFGTSRTFQPTGTPCTGYNSNGAAVTAYMGYSDTYGGEYRPVYVYRGTSYGEGSVVNQIYRASELSQASAELSRFCASLTGPPSLSELAANNPAVLQAVRDITNQYLNTNPSAALTILQPSPNINEAADDVVDPGLDTDGDGITDGDELRRGPGVTTQPGNRPSDRDGPITDPSDSTSRPTDTDRDGVPDWRDADDDNDGAPDFDEEPDTSGDSPQKDPSKKPESYTDTDGDGLSDSTDSDDDGDGWPDSKEIEQGTNPKDDASTPPDEDADGIPDDEEQPEDEETPCQPGQVKGEDGSCSPEEQPEKCPEGTTKNEETGKCDPDEAGKPKDPVEDKCGVFSIPRLMTHTASFLRDVVFPCEKIEDIIKPITERLQAKFPFSLAASLNGWFQAPAGGGESSQLPTALGIIPLDWGWLTPLWAIIKNIVGVALWVWFVYWLIDRFTPRTQI